MEILSHFIELFCGVLHVNTNQTEYNLFVVIESAANQVIFKSIAKLDKKKMKNEKSDWNTNIVWWMYNAFISQQINDHHLFYKQAVSISATHGCCVLIEMAFSFNQQKYTSSHPPSRQRYFICKTQKTEVLGIGYHNDTEYWQFWQIFLGVRVWRHRTPIASYQSQMCINFMHFVVHIS